MKLIRRRKPSVKTMLGITKAKRQVSRAIGIPTTKTGRKRKVKNALTGGVYGKYQRTRAAVNRPFKYAKSPHSCLGLLVSTFLQVICLALLLVWIINAI